MFSFTGSHTSGSKRIARIDTAIGLRSDVVMLIANVGVVEAVEWLSVDDLADLD